MTSRERVLTALDRNEPDRIPLDICATPEVWRKLQAYFGTEDTLAIQERLHVDGFASVGPKYIGPQPPTYDDGAVEDMWGIRTRPVQYATGEYAEVCHYPLASLETVADVESHPWPSPDWFDFSTVREQCEAARDRAIMGGWAAPFYLYNQMRGLELSLMDLALRPDLAHAILGRIFDFHYRYYERLFEAGGGLIDVAHVTDDLGTQRGLMISEAMVDEFLMPGYRRLAGLITDHGARVFHHDDGAMWPLIPRLLEIGVSVLDPIQYRCGPVNLAWLKRTYGERLAFHGGVDNQRALPFGTVEDVRAEVRMLITALGPGGGFMLGPCHAIQAVTPVENILAMYETAYEEGRY